MCDVFQVNEDLWAIFLDLLDCGIERKYGHGGTDDNHEITATVLEQRLGIVFCVPKLIITNEVPTLMKGRMHFLSKENNVWFNGTLAWFREFLRLFDDLLEVLIKLVLTIFIFLIFIFFPMEIACASVYLLLIDVLVQGFTVVFFFASAACSSNVGTVGLSNFFWINASLTFQVIDVLSHANLENFLMVQQVDEMMCGSWHVLPEVHELFCQMVECLRLLLKVLDIEH